MKMNLDTDIENINYILYMQEMEKESKHKKLNAKQKYNLDSERTRYNTEFIEND